MRSASESPNPAANAEKPKVTVSPEPDFSVFTITSQNYGEAEDAIRDILMMYVDMATSYGGFGHATDVYIRFEPLRFVRRADRR